MRVPGSYGVRGSAKSSWNLVNREWFSQGLGNYQIEGCQPKSPSSLVDRGLQ